MLAQVATLQARQIELQHARSGRATNLDHANTELNRSCKELQRLEALLSEATKGLSALEKQRESQLAGCWLPLQASIAQLDQIDKSSLNEIRRYQRPPGHIMCLLSAVAFALGVQQDWSSITVMLGDTQLLERMASLHTTQVRACLLAASTCVCLLCNL